MSAPRLNFQLNPGSPAIDAGAPGFVIGNGELDLAGATRVIGARIDLGAYESAP